MVLDGSLIEMISKPSFVLIACIALTIVNAPIGIRAIAVVEIVWAIGVLKNKRHKQSLLPTRVAFVQHFFVQFECVQNHSQSLRRAVLDKERLLHTV